MMYPCVVFLGAFLLLAVQPMVGNLLLPRFGGTSAVWATCLMFFQCALVLGYAYAHLLAARLPGRVQPIVHLCVLAAAGAMLPISLPAPAEVDSAQPLADVLLALLRSVGAPFTALAATTPLLQSWFARIAPGRSPYRLYAISNAGSLLGLLSYPFLVEPNLGLTQQTFVWSAGFGLFAIGCAVCGFQAWASSGGRGSFRAASPGSTDPTAMVDSVSPAVEIALPGERGSAGASPSPTSSVDRLLWLLLPACGSLLLVGTTNQLTQDVAAGPFLWVIPLSLYLVTFILCFESDRWYRRPVWIAAFAAAANLGIAALFLAAHSAAWQQLAIHSAVLFAGGMICHGETARLRPGVEGLTGFYLLVSLGGALGGTVGAVAGPLLFDGFWEYHLALPLIGLLLVVCLLRDPDSFLGRGSNPVLKFAALGFVGVLAYALHMHRQASLRDAVFAERSFYGSVRVTVHDEGTPQRRRELIHGRILHGVQYFAAARRGKPTAYFGPGSGAGLALRNHPDRDRRPLRVGVVGMGAAVLAVYGRPGDEFRFYEIDPAVIRAARTHFTFLADCPARTEVVAGDARRQMELETDRAGAFDVLILDAFTSHAIPRHLLTREAMDLWRSRLAGGGVLVFNITNSHVDVSPVIRGSLGDSGLTIFEVIQPPDADAGLLRSRWLVASSNPAFLNLPIVRAALAASTPDSRVVHWTDDRSSLLDVLIGQ